MAISISKPNPFRGHPCTALLCSSQTSAKTPSSTVCRISCVPKRPVGTGALNLPSRVATVAAVPSAISFCVKAGWSSARPSVEKTDRKRSYSSEERRPRWRASAAEKHMSTEMACPWRRGGVTASSSTGDQVCPKYMTRSRDASRELGTSTSRTDWIAGAQRTKSVSFSPNFLTLKEGWLLFSFVSYLGESPCRQHQPARYCPRPSVQNAS